MSQFLLKLAKRGQNSGKMRKKFLKSRDSADFTGFFVPVATEFLNIGTNCPQTEDFDKNGDKILSL